MDNFFSALLGALMDPILLGSAVFAGLIPERWLRGVVAALIAMVISVLIVVSLGFAGAILPSDRPGLLFSGSIARWLVAWGIAEVVAFTWWRLKRRKKTAEIHPDLQEPIDEKRKVKRYGETTYASARRYHQRSQPADRRGQVRQHDGCHQ